MYGKYQEKVVNTRDEKVTKMLLEIAGKLNLSSQVLLDQDNNAPIGVSIYKGDVRDFFFFWRLIFPV